VTGGTISAKVTLDGQVFELVVGTVERRRAEMELPRWLASRGNKDFASLPLATVTQAKPEAYTAYLFWVAATRSQVTDMPFTEWWETVDIQDPRADEDAALDPTNPAVSGS
jgi:hypothetical protein